MVSNRQFYLEVMYMSDEARAFSQFSGWVDVSSEMNYLAIDSDKMVFQVVPNLYLTTNWGFGNIPIYCDLSQYDLKMTEKSGDGYFIRFHAIATTGIYDISLTVSPVGKVMLRMAKDNGEMLQFKGDLIPLNQSRLKAGFI